MGASSFACANATAGNASAVAAMTAAMRRVKRELLMGPRTFSGGEAVTDFPDRDEVPRIGGIVLELLPELRHVGIDGARQHDRAMIPHLAEQLDARRDGSLSLD